MLSLKFFSQWDFSLFAVFFRSTNIMRMFIVLLVLLGHVVAQAPGKLSSVAVVFVFVIVTFASIVASSRVFVLN